MLQNQTSCLVTMTIQQKGTHFWVPLGIYSLYPLVYTAFSAGNTKSNWDKKQNIADKDSISTPPVDFSSSQPLILKGVNSNPRQPITVLIEHTSKESDFDLGEQLQRLQFYNEYSVFPLLPLEQEAFPIIDSEGLPYLENTFLGTGIPVKCLRHMLKNGLLLQDNPPPPCIRRRLDMPNLSSDSKCPYKHCPFLISRKGSKKSWELLEP